jgi:hypothetical protein
LAVLGVGAGIGAGLMLKPAPETENAEAVDCPVVPIVEAGDVPPVRVDAAQLEDREFIKLSNQFVLPVITDTRVAALVVLSITIETQVGKSEVVYAREPKLRDLFLQTLFDHASQGRFSGDFASAANLRPLRDELTLVARRVLGPEVSDVLLTDLARQDA